MRRPSGDFLAVASSVGVIFPSSSMRWITRLRRLSASSGFVSGETVVAVREVNLVGVHREDLRLGVAPLDLQRQENFLHFAAEAAVASVQEKIPGKLHGVGAGAAGDASLDEIGKSGAGHAREVDAPVLLEVLVFDGGDRAVEHFGTLLVSHQDAALQREAAGQLAVIGVNFGDNVGAVGFQRAYFWQVAGVNKE